jgi:hypothetical protein
MRFQPNPFQILIKFDQNPFASFVARHFEFRFITNDSSRMILPPRNVSLEKWFNSIKENEDEEQAETRAVHTGV